LPPTPERSSSTFCFYFHRDWYYGTELRWSSRRQHLNSIKSSNMASVVGPDSDNNSELTTLVSGDTPTLPGQEQPSIRALFEAHDDAAYDLAVVQIPRDHRVQVKGIWYVRYEPYRQRRSRRSAWYWAKEQAEELIRTSKGKYSLTIDVHNAYYM
jgi:hypothetical protein